MKAQGATKMASIGYGISPSSTAAAKSNSQYAAPAAGMQAVYTNTTVDFGSTDVSPIVLGIKNSGADAAFYAMNANTNLAIVQGLVQNGVKMKAELMATGYGQQLLDEPSSAQIGPEVLFTQQWAPVEAKTKATKQFQADLKKYANFTGVPDFGIYTGYIDCDLAITGLKQQGKNLDQSTYADGIRKLGKINPGGSRLPAPRLQRRDLRPAGSHDLQLRDAGQERQVRRPEAEERQRLLGREAGRHVGHRATTTTSAP